MTFRYHAARWYAARSSNGIDNCRVHGSVPGIHSGDAVNWLSMQISKRLVGMHPDKVLGALQSHIDAGHEKSALQAIPDLQLQHPQFHNELEQTKARLSAKLVEGVKVLDRRAAEVFRCVNCGGGLSRQHPESTHVICQYCGCDAEHPAQNIHLERWNKALDLESNFTVGDFFEFEEQRWQAIGVQLFSGRVREYGEDGWETNFSRYTSWWMLNERRELAWLVDDGRKRYWADKYIPQKPSKPESSDKKYEHGTWTLEFAAGEFSYQPVPGEKLNTAEKARKESMPVRPGGRDYSYYTSVETRLDANDKPKEIEFTRSRVISNEDMMVGLGKSTEFLDLKRWRHSIFALIAALPLLLGVSIYLNKGGEQIVEAVDLNNQSVGVQLQSLKVEEAGTLFEMSAGINSIKANTWFGVDFFLENSDGEIIYNKYLEFWRETGVDSDGRWDESLSGISWHVRVDEPDTYKAVVSVDPASTRTATGFQLKAEPNRVPVKPFIIAGVFSLFLMMLCRSKLSSVTSVAASIAVKLRRRFDPAGKPAKERSEREVWESTP